MFGFENLNGYLKMTFHGTRRIVFQMTFHAANFAKKVTLPKFNTKRIYTGVHQATHNQKNFNNA